MKTIAVFGSNGMLGYAVSEYFRSQGYDVKCLTRNDFDIAKDEMDKLEDLISGVDVVINCAGVIVQRIDEYPIEEILKVNAIFPINLAKLCNKKHILCFHITTDCVYSGKKGAYVESDYFDAEDVYGMSKNASDTKECMTLRTSIIGDEKSHFKSLLCWVKSQRGNTINGYVDHYWNGVTTLYLAEIIKNILDLELYEKGIFHIYSKKVVSKYELVKMINEIYDLGIVVNKFETGSLCDHSLKSEFDLSDRLVKKDLKTQINELNLFFERLNSN